MDMNQPHIGLKSASPQTPNSANALASSGSESAEVMIPSPLALEQAIEDHSTGYRNGLSPVLPVLSQRGPSWGGLLNEFEPKRGETQAHETIQEACLLRYYVNELAHWVRILCFSSAFVHVFVNNSSLIFAILEAGSSSLFPNGQGDISPCALQSMLSQRVISAASQS